MSILNDLAMVVGYYAMGLVLTVFTICGLFRLWTTYEKRRFLQKNEAALRDKYASENRLHLEPAQRKAHLN